MPLKHYSKKRVTSDQAKRSETGQKPLQLAVCLDHKQDIQKQIMSGSGGKMKAITGEVDTLK